jgi:hypothetical protein
MARLVNAAGAGHLHAGRLHGHLGRRDLHLRQVTTQDSRGRHPASTAGTGTKAAKLADGSWRYPYEDVTTATGIPAARLEEVRSWVDAPYHRLPLMDANTRHIGCSVSERTVNGRTHSAEVLGMAATWKDTTRQITVYPANGQTGVPISFNRCQEHPTPFGAPATGPIRSRMSAMSWPSRPTATTP